VSGQDPVLADEATNRNVFSRAVTGIGYGDRVHPEIVLALVERGFLVSFRESFLVAEIERCSDFAFFRPGRFLKVEPEHLAFSEAAKRILPRVDAFAMPLIEQVRV
jgi:hypothetical protein